MPIDFVRHEVQFDLSGDLLEMISTTKRLLCVAATVTIGLVLFASYVSFGHSLLHLDVSGFTTFFSRTAPPGRTVAPSVVTCETTWQPTDADRNESDRMALYLETVVGEYQTNFGKLPKQISDLDKVPSFENADRVNGREFTKSCYIRARAQSYVLGCSALRPSVRELDDFLNKSVRPAGFYKLSGKDILYIPNRNCS